MNPESKSRLLSVAEVVGLCLVVLIIGLAVGYYFLGGNRPSTSTGPDGTNQSGSQTSDTRGEVSSDIRVPEAGEEQSGDIAVPTIVADAAPGAVADLRGFTIRVEGNRFSPAEVIVRQGDTTRITFQAVDRDYDFAQPDLGLSRSLPQGEDAIVEVAPTETGRFTFFCSSCGGPSSGPVGYITVVAR